VVQVRSDRWYAVDADRREVWAAFGATDRYRQWWPWLTEFDGGPLAVGACWHCAVSPPLPYVVRFTLALVSVEEGRAIRATVDGDITGSAALDLVDHRCDDPPDDAPDDAPDEGAGRPGRPLCRIHLRSWLAPSHPALKVVAGVAAPLVRRGHDWVLDTGARQFRDRAL
jgi:hypothetical protein